MSTTLFISDIHLDASAPETAQAFKDTFSGPGRQADAVYILGDLFDAWIGDDDLTPFNRDIIKTLHDFTSTTHIPTYFIHGNRDFLIGKRFSKMTGVQILHELTVIDLYGTPTLLLHGDTLCINDVAYQKFRKKSRGPLFKLLNIVTPLWVRRKIANKLRQKSKEHFNSLTDKTISDVCLEEVDRVMQHYNVTQMIHGHTHRPCIHDNGRIVLGAWHHTASILYARDSAAPQLTTTKLTRT
ncbi:MAG: UDP-2,3-diacylglucosamine diphosphatase [Coxiella sp. (in: Bacteria)]|nr:MAG: UDP-2,3-diacylglucosamine diphosphatase [Coxiella sp. (in: g-proteobacteria)]